MTNQIKGFTNFIREQGVVGLAVGFILGGAVSQVVSTLVQDVINPLLSVVLGQGEALSKLSVSLGDIEIRWGSFAAVVVDFIVIALVVYFGVKLLGLEKLDKKKSK